MASVHVSSSALLYSRHQRQLEKLARSIVGCPYLAEEVVQEVFVRFISRPPAREAKSQMAYLRTMVRNLSYDIVRRQIRESKAQNVLMDLADADLARQTEANPEMVALWRSEYDAFCNGIESLPPLMREALRLFVGDHLTYPQIAEKLNVSVGKAHYLVKDGFAECLKIIRVSKQ